MITRSAGLHHLTAIAGDPAPNVAFYRDLLGLRLVKRTVNFDDPGSWHLYYGNRTGAPGTILTFFAWPGAPRGRPGVGAPFAAQLRIPVASLPFWRERLAAGRVHAEEGTTVAGEPVLRFVDPDGMRVELVAHGDPEADAWDGTVAREHAITALHGIVLRARTPSLTVEFLRELLGYAVVTQAGDVQRLGPAEGGASFVDLETGEPGRALMGAGSIHHVAFRAADRAEQQRVHRALVDRGLGVSPVMDRQYFESIYVREPQGVLVEVATDAPGMLIDEDEATLGTTLRLPPWYEASRADIERVLPPLEPAPALVAATLAPEAR